MDDTLAPFNLGIKLPVESPEDFPSIGWLSGRRGRRFVHEKKGICLGKSIMKIGIVNARVWCNKCPESTPWEVLEINQVVSPSSLQADEGADDIGALLLHKRQLRRHYLTQGILVAEPEGFGLQYT